MEDTMEDINSLVSELKRYRAEYYQGLPTISDADFDELEDKLRLIDPTNEYFTLVGAPVVGTRKRKHTIAMGSLAKCKIEEGGIDLIINDFLNKGSCVLSHKLDGISFATEYIDGVHQHATTRGDGVVGEDIPNATDFKNVPQRTLEPFTGTARGELVMSYKDFDYVNSQLPEDDKFSNPRNAVAGIARKADSPFRKYITAFYYDMTDDLPALNKIEVLGGLCIVFGFDCVVKYHDMPYVNADSVVLINAWFTEFANGLDKTRKELPYMIDGLVVEFDDRAYFESLGVSENKPKGAIALKFTAVAEKTYVIRVVWQVGSTGVLTPVVEFVPTLIDGSIVRRASIHNYDIFKEWNFHVGDEIEVQKNNDIIPQVKSVVTRHTENDVCGHPTHCPECDEELSFVKIDKTTNLVCINPLCKAKFVGAVKKWATKSGMASKGVGDAFFEAYANKYDTVEELYSLSVEDIMSLSDRYKDKSATKIYEAIQSSKTMKLMDFFGGLNIYESGSRTFKKLIDDSKINDIHTFCDMVECSDLTLTKGIGEITAKSITEGLQKLTTMIDKLSRIVTITSEQIGGESILFTGAFVSIDPTTGKRYTRERLEALIVEKGYSVATTVNKELGYLVTSDPDSTSSKMVKAKKLGVKILSESDFFNMIGM